MNKLLYYRIEIENIDVAIIDLIAQRLLVCQKIGIIKKTNNIPIIDNKRFEELLLRNINIFIGYGFNERYIIDLYNIIHKYSIEIQVDKI